MIGHHLFACVPGRRRHADLREPFVNVLHLAIPCVRARLVVHITGQQLRVMLQMRAATAGVRDDGVELLRRKLVDVLPREPLRQLPLAVVRVQRAAAMLLRRRHHLATIARQHLHCVAVHIAEDEILRAADEHRHAILLLTRSRCDGINQLCGKFLLHLGRHRLQFTQALGQQLEHSRAPDERLQAELLIQTQDVSDQLQPVQIHEQPVQREGADGIALG